ncbi:Quinolone resistance protein norA [Proteiniborus sp. DW1]|nr:MFS transporter [Proteiniborus sp. DW1]SCG84019.1 Quinolone resistance protein norA [Proteiniborus sp. DW1]
MQGLNKVVFYISFPLSFIAFIFPIYASSLGVSVVEIGFLYTIFSIVSILIRPIVGNMIDKKGRKKGLIIGVALYALVNILYSIAVDYRYLLIARILQSIAASFLWISIDAAVSDISSKENRAQNFGILDQSQIKGELLGITIAFTILYNNFFENPFSKIFMVYFITSIASLFYAFKSVPETLDYKKDIESGMLKNSKHMRYFLIAMGIISFISSLTAPIYLIYLQQNIASELHLISYLFLPSAILSMFLPRRFGIYADKYGREKVIVIGMLLSAVLQIFVPFVRAYYPFMIIYTLISVVSMFYSPAFSSIIIDFVGENKRGRSYGLYSFASGIGGALGTLVGTYVYENIGNSIVFYLQGSLLVTAIVSIYFIYNKIKSNEVRYNEEVFIHSGGTDYTQQ